MKKIEYEVNSIWDLRELAQTLDYPVWVYPTYSIGDVGVTRVDMQEQLWDAFDEAFLASPIGTMTISNVPREE